MRSKGKGDMMFDKKDEFVPTGAAETVVGTSVKLKGNLKSDGDITVDGSVNGEIKTKGTVTVGPNANIIANVHAKNVNIAGTVQGNIVATDRLNISESGRVYGDISANILSVAAGALFSGKSTMAENIKEPEIELTVEKDEEPTLEEVLEPVKK
jgi:cytoskeletal protein CcmA (bactofilin family)